MAHYRDGVLHPKKPGMSSEPKACAGRMSSDPKPGGGLCSLDLKDTLYWDNMGKKNFLYQDAIFCSILPKSKGFGDSWIIRFRN